MTSSGVPTSVHRADGGGSPRRLRIGYLSGSARIATRDDAELSGPRAHIVGFVDALRQDGHEVHEFVLGDLLGRSLSGVGSQRLVTGGRLRQLAVDVARIGLRFQVARRAARELPGPFDVVYERFALFQELGGRYRRDGATWVVEANAYISEEARHERNALALQWLARRLERRTYRRADVVVVVSDALREILVTRAGVHPDKVVVVPNAVDIRRFEFRPLPIATGAEETVVGFVGFVIERQGLDELIIAVTRLRQHGRRVRAVIVGDGPDRARLERLAAAQGDAGAVQFAGQVPWSDVPAWIETFTVGYSGQRGVGGMTMYHSPLKIYEYLATGRPVVATRHADAEHALAGAGWTFPAGDVDALVGVLEHVSSLDRQRIAEAGACGRRHVEQHHTWRSRTARISEALVRREGLR